MILAAKDIAEITRLLDDSHFSELRLEIGEFKLRVSRGGSGRRLVEENEEPAPVPTQSRAPTQAGPSGEEARGPSPAKAGKDEVDIPAPLLGNFYHSPRPGDPPFVQIGDVITADSAIGIIEVMKLMNSVRSGVAGTVVAILAPDSQAVEEGQPLIRVKVG
ncbi:MAG: hypothetical protein P0Y56_06850 [Candidatus Andeanibacterium colombiense]|uniref:Biotin carboxyl carrier protein of acetyl-CoA carboxylase n=1 Tax=Candidatus Andeanibacterium colombiense TaxID=3121345 RepID=A0AAJ6BP20_9SPHN|nr:MAG: hypothetical protein P0Y56_06850 [Sphingomonadaceae bacterium]